MNKDDLIGRLENVDLSEIALPGHQRRLGKALLNSGCFKERTIMSLLKRTSPVGGAIAAGLLAAVLIVGFKATPSVSAQQIVQKSYKAVSGLPPAHQAALQSKLHLPVGPVELLQEAVNAPDLKVLTSAEFVSQYGGMVGTTP